MKYILATLLILFNACAVSQAEKASVVTRLDIADATKDGIYLNGYVVNIDYEQAQKLNGKTIKVTGKVTIVKGLDSEPKEFDKNGNEIIKQGRSQDTKHILSPKIKILE